MDASCQRPDLSLQAGSREKTRFHDVHRAVHVVKQHGARGETTASKKGLKSGFTVHVVKPWSALSVHVVKHSCVYQGVVTVVGVLCWWLGIIRQTGLALLTWRAA